MINYLLMTWCGLTIDRRTIGIRLSVNWYVTDDDASHEGKAQEMIILSLPVVSFRKKAALSTPHVDGITMAD